MHRVVSYCHGGTMTDFDPLSLYTAKVYYTDDPTQFKWRPIIIMDEFAYTVLPVTTVLSRWGYIIQDWEAANLDEPSLINTDAYMAINRKNIGKYIGELSDRDVDKFEEFIDLFPPKKRK